MKIFFLCIVLFFAILVVLVSKCNREVEKQYFGPVIEKGKEEPTSGYKSRQEAVYYVIIRDIECNKFIRVHVNVPTWYSCEVNKAVCFTLTERDLYHYHNTTKWEHLK